MPVIPEDQAITRNEVAGHVITTVGGKMCWRCYLVDLKRRLLETGMWEDLVVSSNTRKDGRKRLELRGVYVGPPIGKSRYVPSAVKV